ncbi:MAG: hypothetical protein ACFFD1_11950 [Candidatus Thorarchaeota archaeon]
MKSDLEIITGYVTILTADIPVLLDFFVLHNIYLSELVLLVISTYF